MDSEHWISRLAAAKRFYAAQLGHSDRAGMDELDMDEEVRPEFACPYCYEDHDVGSLCAHLEEEHPFEPQAAACPVCSEMVTKDMVNHIAMQHGYLFKNRRRLCRFIIPGSQALSLLSRDLREAHLQVLLGGGHRSSNNNNTTNISADPLLSSFGLSFPTSDAEQTSKSTITIPDDATMVKESPAQARTLREILCGHANLSPVAPPPPRRGRCLLLIISIRPSQVKKGSRNGSKPASEPHSCKTCCSLLYSGTDKNQDEAKSSLEGCFPVQVCKD